MYYVRSDIINFTGSIPAADGTFPDHADTPAEIFVIFNCLFVTFHIPLEFAGPERQVCFWNMMISAVLVGMPETSINENHSVVTGKHNVRLSGITLVADAVTETGMVQSFADDFLGSGVPALYVRHV